MYDKAKEKRKGLPGTRGGWYLIAGIAIGVAVAGGALAIINGVGIIDDPADPVSSTMLAQGQAVAQEPPRLTTFAVNEAQNTLALSYWNGQNHLEIWPWDGAQTDGSPEIILDQNQAYNLLSFHPTATTIIANTGKDTRIFDLSTSETLTTLSHVTKALYSPDGQWLVLWKDTGTIEVQSASLEVVTTNLLIEGSPADVVFSPNSQHLAVLSKSRNEDTLYTEVFQLPYLKRVQIYRTPINSSIAPIPRFNADGTQISVTTSAGVTLFSLIAPEERFFDVPNTMVRDVAFDPSGRWLVVSSYDPYSRDTSGLYVYVLTNPPHLPPTLPNVQFIPVNNPGHIEFVREGLLVGSVQARDGAGLLTLYHQTDSGWGNPRVVLTASDLE